MLRRIATLLVLTVGVLATIATEPNEGNFLLQNDVFATASAVLDEASRVLAVRRIQPVTGTINVSIAVRGVAAVADEADTVTLVLTPVP